MVTCINFYILLLYQHMNRPFGSFISHDSWSWQLKVKNTFLYIHFLTYILSGCNATKKCNIINNQDYKTKKVVNKTKTHVDLCTHLHLCKDMEISLRLKHSPRLQSRKEADEDNECVYFNFCYKWFLWLQVFYWWRIVNQATCFYKGAFCVSHYFPWFIKNVLK